VTAIGPDADTDPFGIPVRPLLDVIVVGAGPAGLAAAVELRKLGAVRVLVVEREEAPGGAPRHCPHPGFGLGDMGRLLTGPAYARRCARAAVAAGVEIRTATLVTGWEPPVAEGVHQVTLTSAAGAQTLTAAAVLLATGCRERPRAARLIPGGRPPGIMTTGELQRRVAAGERVTGRVLVVGAGNAAFSALATLARTGAQVVALVTAHPRHTTFPALAWLAARRWHVPVWTATTVSRIDGDATLTGVELAGVDTGESRFVHCDAVVFTGDLVPEYELARLAGLDMDPGTGGPAVDTALATSAPMVFAAGDLVHTGSSAGGAAYSGWHAARQAVSALGGNGQHGRRLPVTVAAPLTWISPNVIRPGGPQPPREAFLVHGGTFGRPARLEVLQGGMRLARTRPLRAIPGRPVRLPAGWVDRASADGGPVTVRLTT
jgi:thioredoxin reductase